MGNDVALLADHQRGRVWANEGTYPLSVGQSYAVLGMGIWESTLCVLVRVDWGGPFWCPAGFFDISAQMLPAEWWFTTGTGLYRSGREAWGLWVARWGYRELVEDDGHLEGLVNGDPDAVAIFERELARIESSTPPG